MNIKDINIVYYLHKIRSQSPRKTKKTCSQWIPTAISSMMDNEMDFNTNHLQQISGKTERCPSATNVTNHCFSVKTCEHPHFFINCPSFSMVLPPPNMGTFIPFSERSAFSGLPKQNHQFAQVFHGFSTQKIEKYHDSRCSSAHVMMVRKALDSLGVTVGTSPKSTSPPKNLEKPWHIHGKT